MVLPDSDGIPRVPPYSGSTATALRFAYGTVTPYGRPFQTVLLAMFGLIGVLQPQSKTGLGSSRFARRYSGNRFFFLFLRVLRCFSSPGLPLTGYVFTRQSHYRAGFPHSEISGSTLTYSSPEHIGVGSVLHRLLVPRHPPCALHYLIAMKL